MHQINGGVNKLHVIKNVLHVIYSFNSNSECDVGPLRPDLPCGVALGRRLGVNNLMIFILKRYRPFV